MAATEVELESGGRLSRSGHVTDGGALAMRWLLLVDNPLTWSSVMVRAAAVRQIGQFVRPEYQLADDFDLYHRLLRIGDIVRLPEALTVYRWHGTNTARGGRDILMANAAKVLCDAYRPWLGEDADPAAELAVRHLAHRQPVTDEATLDRLGGYLERLLQGFCHAQALGSADRAKAAALAGEVWWGTVRAAVRAGRPALGRVFHAHAVLAAGFRPAGADRAVSISIGAARAVLPGWRRTN